MKDSPQDPPGNAPMSLASTIIAAGTSLLLAGAGAFVLSTGQVASACGAAPINVATAAAGRAVAGYTGDQLANAAIIINTGSTAGLDSQGEILGVMTAMAESGLRNLDYGDSAAGVTNPDGTPTDSVGLFQQQRWWGTLAERMNPATAASLFFAALTRVPGWQRLTPTEAAHAVQGNADPNLYTKYFLAATTVVITLTSTDGAGSCAVSSDEQVVAQQLVGYLDSGRLVGSVPDHMKEIRWIAQGRTVPDCGIDLRVLQILLLAVQHFDQVGVSDINRKCTGQILGLGTRSMHYADGGGRAVDFYLLDNRHLTGADGLSLRLIALLDPIMPVGAHVGQQNVRITQGVAVTLTRWTGVTDTPDHLHIDVGTSNNPLLLN
jgi:hypothetical protein